VQSHTPYDIVHSHVYLFSGFVLALARLEGISTRIAHIHPTQDWAGRERPSLARPIYRWLMVNSINANAVHLLFASHQAQAAFARLGGRQAPNSRVLYCGIDFAKFAEHSSRQATRQELGIPDNAKVVLTVGRFVPHKNHRHLVEIARQVRAVRDDVIFLLVGTGPLLSEIQNLVSERGLSACFRFVPSLEEIASVYRAADLFLFPSLMEGFGRVVVEAAASGLPIVASDIPGIDESSRASAYPALIEPQNTAGFSSAVLEGLKQPRARFSPDAERLEPLSLSTSIKNLVNVYDPTGDMR
jgi:glycosyltransferase EpsF